MENISKTFLISSQQQPIQDIKLSSFLKPEVSVTIGYLEILSFTFQIKLETELMGRGLLLTELKNDGPYIEFEGSKYLNRTYAFTAKTIKSLKEGLKDLQEAILFTVRTPISFRHKLEIEEYNDMYTVFVRFTEVGNPSFKKNI